MIETMQAADAYNVSETVVNSLSKSLDGIPFKSHLDRLVTGTGIHCVRRGAELKGSIELLKEAGLSYEMTEASKHCHEVLEKYGFAAKFANEKPDGWKSVIEPIPNFIISSIIGIIIGILPGIGGSTAGLIAYTEEKNRSKNPEKFGTGCIDGVIASETANNAVIGGSLVPLLCMGIPGNTVAAVFLGGLLVHGISPGPLIYDKNGTVVYAIYIALIVSTIFMFVFERLGLLGLLMKIFKLPGTPLIIGFILGDMFETNFRRAMQASHLSWSFMWTKPICLGFLIAAVLFVAYILWTNNKAKKKAEARNQTFDTAEEEG